MKVELSQAEVRIISEALEVWEKDAGTSAMMVGLMGAMICPKESRDDYALSMKKEQEMASREGEARKMKSILIRAKLYQADTRNTEQELEKV